MLSSTQTLKKLLVPGGAGFIGSNFVLDWIANGGEAITLDWLAYAGNRANLAVADSAQMLYIPVGFGHAFAALTDNAGLAYKVTDFYSPAGERTLLWNDPVLEIEWPFSAESAILSDKDSKGTAFRDAEVFA